MSAASGPTRPSAAVAEDACTAWDVPVPGLKQCAGVIRAGSRPENIYTVRNTVGYAVRSTLGYTVRSTVLVL